MPTRDERIAELGSLKEAAPDAALRTKVQKALATKHHRVIEAAACVAEAWEDASLVESLSDAFERCMRDPAKSDPGCGAKLACVRALHAIGYADFELYLRATRHRQPEPVFGGSEDTAPALRVAAAHALAELAYPDWDYVVTALLTDPEAPARRGAIHLLGKCGGREAELLLRLKTATSMLEPDVVAECLSALMAINPAGSCEYVSEFLHGRDPELVESAALALGESRIPEAFARLRAAWESTIQDHEREPLLLALAIHRSDDSLEFLLSVVRDARAPFAAKAVSALAIYRNDQEVAGRIRTLVGERSEDVLRKTLATEFS